MTLRIPHTFDAMFSNDAEQRKANQAYTPEIDEDFVPGEARGNIVPLPKQEEREQKGFNLFLQNRNQCVQGLAHPEVENYQTAIPGEQQTMASYSFQLREESNSDPRAYVKRHLMRCE